ncbi:MAG: hypothetical protein ACIARR_03620 [Phycisphaerales bacterium JB059]
MHFAFLLTQAPAPEPDALGGSVRLLFVTALLGVVLITAITLMLVLRRNRIARAALKGRSAPPTPDPWSEAGRRATVPHDPDPEGPVDRGPPTDPPHG